jgi:hypothetical protein
MVVIEDLARELADLYDIDLGAARADVEAYASQISDETPAEGLVYDENGGFALTEQDADVIRAQMSSVYGSANIDIDEARDELRDAQSMVDTFDRHLGRRDAAVRTALAKSVPVKDIAADTGLSRARIYQIRDGRR